MSRVSAQTARNSAAVSRRVLGVGVCAASWPVGLGGVSLPAPLTPARKSAALAAYSSRLPAAPLSPMT